MKRLRPSILVELGAMIQFGIKSLILVTAVVAAYSLIIHAARNGQSLTCLFALLLYIALIGFGVMRAEYTYEKRAKISREADESNPAD